MNTKEMCAGGWATSLTSFVALLTVGKDEVVASGFVLAMLIILVFCVVVRLILASATKDSESTNWSGFGSFALGAGLSTGVILAIYMLAS